MYATHQEVDGYKALAFCLKKLFPTCPALFQYPVMKSWKPTNTIWFESQPLGVKLGRMMADISEAAGLSRIYTNHSVRATAITLWSNAGISNCHIMAISGHQNEQSLVHYNERQSSSQLCNCSDVLSRSLFSGHPLSVLHLTLRYRSTCILPRQKWQ